MKCPICKFDNQEESLFCMSCGNRIPRCPACGRPLTNRDRFCVYDGTPIPEEILAMIPEDDTEKLPLRVQSSLAQESVPQAFCMNCGSPCSAGEDYCDDCKGDLLARKERPAPRKKKKTGLVIALLLLLLLLIGGVVLGVAIRNGDVELPFLASDKGREKGSDDEDEDDDSDKDQNHGETDAGEGESVDSDREESAQEEPSEEITGATEAATEEPTEEYTEAATEEPTEEYTEAETEPERGTLEYFVTYCDTVYFTEEDLEGFTAEECRIARNACYAHSGRMFNDTQLQEYYAQFDWYEPRYTPENFPENALNACQRDNIQLVSSYESEMGYR